MNPKVSALFIGLIVVACFIAGVVLYPHLPNVIATHLGASGRVNGHSSKVVGVFALPGIMLLLMGLWALLPAIDPIAKGFKGFRHVYDFFWICMTAFFAYAYALLLYVNVGGPIRITQEITPVLGLLFILLGALLPFIHRNWFFGIRTPWTLSSDEDWRRTHRFASPLVIASGALTLIGGFSGYRSMLWVGVGCLIASALASVVYSYLIYRRAQ